MSVVFDPDVPSADAVGEDVESSVEDGVEAEVTDAETGVFLRLAAIRS